MRITPERIARDIEAIGGITETPGNGCSRPTFSPQWAAARDYVIAEAEKVGGRHRIDAAGNVHIRPSGLSDEARVWLSGSHIDTVPHGGKYDGVAGIVAPLEVLRAAHEAGRTLPLELIIFAEEEGTTFGLGMLGSRAWAGTLSVEQLGAVKNREGQNYLAAGALYGVNPSRLANDRLDPTHYLGLVEIHIEQGPAMWEQNIPVANVTAINGRRQFSCTVRGVANHAGSTPMGYRFDALAAAAEILVGLEKLPATQSPQTVLTVGRITAHPNAVNVIPDEVTFTIDFRSPDNRIIDSAPGCIEECIEMICRRRGLKHELGQTEHLPTVALDGGVCDRIRAAAQSIGLAQIAQTTSGALHDAAILAPLLPTAMLFVASRDGISHNPGEFSRVEDIVVASRILAETLT